MMMIMTYIYTTVTGSKCLTCVSSFNSHHTLMKEAIVILINNNSNNNSNIICAI